MILNAEKNEFIKNAELTKLPIEIKHINTTATYRPLLVLFFWEPSLLLGGNCKFISSSAIC